MLVVMGQQKQKHTYEKILLLDKFNIIVDWQEVSNLPENYMLDLGAWITVQSRVE